MAIRFLFALLLGLAGLAAHAAHGAEIAAIYHMPRPAARAVAPQTAIGLRVGPPLAARSLHPGLLQAHGSRSGAHPGRLVLSADSRTLLLYPAQPFAHGETVTVVLAAGLRTADGQPVAATSWSFTTVDRPLSAFAPPQRPDDQPAQPRQEITVPRLRTVPGFAATDQISVTGLRTETVTPGFHFSTNAGLQISQLDGTPVFLWPTRGYLSDFKRQDVGVTPYLTYSIGKFITGWSYSSFEVMNQRYEVVDRWNVANGYGADLHDFQLLDNGNALLLSYTPAPYDLSPWGGRADAQLVDIIVQEQDPYKNVVFEWRGTDHISVTETILPLTFEILDYIHTNSIDVDHDGHLLLSNRHTADIIKVNRETGAIMWRLGGKQNDFTFTNDDGFLFQHDARRQDTGRISLFDNGDPVTRPWSRAVEYELDESAMVVTRTLEYTASGRIFGQYTGNVQYLANGNLLIGWGTAPDISEVTRAGELLSHHTYNANRSYRTFRHAWHGVPAAPPTVVVDSTHAPTQTLYFSWNGMTEPHTYEIYGSNGVTQTLVTSVAATGFETSLDLVGQDAESCRYRVVPLIGPGRRGPASLWAERTDTPACRAVLLSASYIPMLRHR